MATDPFRIAGPALISFSGGRTSAYLLWRVLQAYDGVLPPDVHVVFANTGKEREETLDFVRDCAAQWNVPVRWVERCPKPSSRKRGSHAFVEVTHTTAHRAGEPFAQMLEQIRRVRRRKGLPFYIPNPSRRVCTTELKIRVMKRVMRALGHAHWDMVMGIRADEPTRVRNLRAPTVERWQHVMPLADAGITEADVMAFWKTQSFDLRLQPHEGNCDVCHLKRIEHRVLIMADDPTRAAWWAEQEELMGLQFLAGTKSRKAEPSYAELNRQAPSLVEGARRRLALLPSAGGIDCFCTD